MAKSRKSSNKKRESVTAPKSERSVSIRRAKNGYVISSWTPKGETTYIAPNEKSATKYMKKLL